MNLENEIVRLKRIVYFLQRKIIAAGNTLLSGLSDVLLSSPSNGQVLTYDSSEGKWVNSTPGSVPETGHGFLGRPTATWTGTGYIFFVYFPQYYISGVLYPSGTGTITLDAADGTNDRLDVIAVDSTGEIKITGTAAANPVKPTVDDLTQLEITTILVQAASTTPVEISEEDIYKENTEWTGSSNISGADFNNTTDPFAGTKNVSIGSFTAGQYVRFVDASTHDISDYNYLRFYVKLKNTFSSTTGFIIVFKNGTTVISSYFTVTNGIYNFDRTDVSGYQLIVIPLSEFTFLSATFDTVEFQTRGSNVSGFRFDNISLQGGIPGATNEQNAIVTIQTDSGAAVADQPNDTIQILGGTNCTTSAVGKVITIDATGGGGTPGGADTYVQYNDAGSFGGEAAFTYNKTTNRLNADYVAVLDDAYDATTWNGNLDVPTKNAVRDKIETLGGGITGSGTSGYVTYWTGASAISGESNLFWDAANNRLGIGTATPSYELDIIKNANADTTLAIQNTTAGTAAQARIALVSSGGSYATIGKYSTSTTAAGIIASGDLYIDNAVTGDIAIQNGYASGKIKFAAGASTSVHAEIASTGIFNFYKNPIVSINQNAVTGFNISNTTSGADSYVNLGFNSSAGNFSMGKFSAAKSSVGIIASNDAFFYNDGAGDITIYNSFGTGKIKFASGGGTNIHAEMASTGVFNFYKNPIVSINQNADTTLTIANTSAGSLSEPRIVLSSDVLSGSGVIGKYSNTTTTSGIISARDFYIYNGNTAGNIVIYNGYSSGGIHFGAGNSSSPNLIISSAGNVGIGITPTVKLQLLSGTAGAMAKNYYEIAAFEKNSDMKVGIYTSSASSGDGADLLFGQTNLQANSLYPGFGLQYIYSSTVANNAMRFNYTERASSGLVQNYAANILLIYANGRVVMNPATSGVTSSAQLLIGTSTSGTYMLDVNGTVRSQGDFTLSDAKNIILNTTTGTKIGTATSQKLGFWNATPIVQPTTAVAAATLVSNGGTTLTDTDTFDGYTLKQIVKALRNTGILA